MLSDALKSIVGPRPTAPFPNECRELLRRCEIPEDIIADLAASSYDSWIRLGPLQILPMPQIIDQTTGIAACLENGFLALASGANGDPVALDRRSRGIVYVSHDILWSDDWKD